MEQNTVKSLRRTSTQNSLLLLLTIVAMVAIPQLIRLASDAFFGIPLFRSKNFLMILQEILIFLTVIPLLLLLYYKKINKSLSFGAVFVKPQRSKGWLIKWSLIALGVSRTFGAVFSNFVLPLLGITGKTGFISGKSDVPGNLVFVISTVILAPVIEELLFRATLFRGICDYGELFAAVLSGVAFGLYHLNIKQVFGAVAFGIIFALIFAKCRSIFAVMLIHAVNNLLSTVLLLARNQIKDIFTSSDLEFVLHALFVKHLFSTVLYVVAVMLSAGVIVAGLILAVIEIVKHKGRFTLANPLGGYSAVKKAAIFFSSPVTLMTFIVMIYLVILSATVGWGAWF